MILLLYYFFYFIGSIIILIFVLAGGALRKRAFCQNCGASVNGSAQTILKPMNVILCPCCAGKIHPRIRNNAREQWTYTDYTDYLKWSEETRAERSQFNPDVVYGNNLALDTKRGLLCLGGWRQGGIILRFADIESYDIYFKPEIMNVFNTAATGDEYINIQFKRPRIFIEDYLKQNVYHVLDHKGFNSSNIEDFIGEYESLVQNFGICYLTQKGVFNHEESNQTQNDTTQPDTTTDLHKALALFMFDSLAEITEEKLKRQRNILIKAFHPDNSLTDDEYSKKINNAYSILLEAIKAA